MTGAELTKQFQKPTPFVVDGVEVLLRPLSAAEWLELQVWNDGHKDDQAGGLGGAAEIVRRAVVNQAGSPVFDAVTVHDLPVQVLLSVAEEVVSRLAAGKKKAGSPETRS